MAKSILLIDDNYNDRQLMKEILASEVQECDVMEASSGEDGIGLVQEKKPDIVILDTIMVGMDGFETCKKIKEIEGIDTKVIIMTGLADAVNAVKAREVGADEYCVKTSDWKKFLSVVQKFL